MLKNQKVGVLLVAVVMLLLLFWRFPDFFLHANQRVAEPYGDGYKAYMVIVNHAKYDSTYSHFEGMNYPYGEHAVPGVTQPLISISINWLRQNIVDISDYTIGIVNLSMMLGLLLCAVFCFLIFKRLGLPTLYSAVVAVGLAFLNPQMERIGSHYGLSHPEIVPMILYFMMRFEENKQLKWSFAVGVTLWAYSLIHFYYFGIFAFAIGIYFSWTTLRDKDFSVKLILKNFGHFTVQVLIAMVFFLYWIYWGDPIDDRCSEPWGFLHFHVDLKGIFTSPAQPYFPNVQYDKWDIENTAYLGAIAIITGTILVLVWLKNLIIKAPIKTESENDFFLNNLWFTSITIGLVSFGLPFTIPGWEFLIEYVQPFEQFRSVGRFAWVSFYGFNIIAFYWLYQKLPWSKWWLVLPVAWLIFEAWNHTNHYDLRLDKIDEFEAGKTFNDIEGIDYNEFQASIPIPYYNIGSGNFWIDVTGYVGQKSQTLAMQTGLPMTAAMLTRSSLSQAFNQFELVYEPYRLPKILDDLPDERPFLLVWDATRTREFSPLYDHMNEGLEMIYENYPLRFYRLPLETFGQRIEERRRNLFGLLQNDSLLATEYQQIMDVDSTIGFYTQDTIDYLLYKNWDDSGNLKNYRGGAGYEGKFGDLVDIIEEAVPKGKYTLSFWMHLHEDLYPRTELILEEYNPENGVIIKREVKPVHHHTVLIGEEGWGLVELPIEIMQDSSRFKIKTQHEKYRFLGKPFYLDELLLRPVGSTVYFKKGNSFVENDRWFEKE
jgi:hypothetical protein